MYVMLNLFDYFCQKLVFEQNVWFPTALHSHSVENDVLGNKNAII